MVIHLDQYIGIVRQSRFFVSLNNLVVIMTDGSNAVQGFSGVFKRGSPHYGGYGPFSDNQLGIDRTVFARQILDRRLLTFCKNMKDKKILVYTIFTR